MGVKSGSFVSRSGKICNVEFRGDSVNNGDIKFSVPPVVISMAAGEHKFCGFKSTTATINILTDEPLIDLYASTITAINVKITEDGECIFNGYVTPFAFDQAYTGNADVVTVQAVDSVTVRKDISYENVGAVRGADLMGTDIVNAIARRAGLTRIVEHVNFSLVEDQGTETLSVKVAQAGFIQDEVSDCDALSAICKFFGYTACALGDTLYLFDEHAMLNADGVHRTLCNYYVYDDARSAWIDMGRFSESTNPLLPQQVGDMQNDISVTIERAYDGIQITPEGSEVSVLMPDVCSSENLKECTGTLGNTERYTKKSDYEVYRTPMESKVLELGKNTPKDYIIEGEITDDWDMSSDPVVSDNWTDGAMALRMMLFHSKTLDVYGEKSSVRMAADEKNVIWIRGAMASPELNAHYIIVGRQRPETCVAHTGGRAAIRMSFVETSKGVFDLSESVSAKPDAADIGILSCLCLRAGEKVFSSDFFHDKTGDPWKKFEVMSYYSSDFSEFTLDGYTLLPTGLGSRIGSATAVVEIPAGETLRVELGWMNQLGACTYAGSNGNLWITSLEVIGDGDDINTACEMLRHSFSNIEGGEYLSVGTHLTTRNSDSNDGVGTGVNARPGIVAGTHWAGSYMGRTDKDEAIPIAGIMMEQLKARYSQPHAAYKMTVRKNIKPYAAVEWNGKSYTVEAYDRDLYDDTTTITID